MSDQNGGTVDGAGRRVVVPGFDGLTPQAKARQMAVELMKNKPQLERLAQEISRREQARITEWLGGQLLPVMPDDVARAMGDGLKLQREQAELGLYETTPNDKLGMAMAWLDREGWHVEDRGNEFVLLKGEREWSRLRKVVKAHGTRPTMRLESAEEGEAD